MEHRSRTWRFPLIDSIWQPYLLLLLLQEAKRRIRLFEIRTRRRIRGDGAPSTGQRAILPKVGEPTGTQRKARSV